VSVSLPSFVNLLTFHSGNSTVAQTIVKAANQTPSLSVAQKFAAMPTTSKIGVYAGGGAAAALLLFACVFSCIRQRRAGRREREAYNAKVEKDREDAYKDQMELREKGLGGWDNGAYQSQGEDALGGWGGSHVPVGTKAADVPPVPKMPPNFQVNEVPPRFNSPAIPRAAAASPAVPRGMNASPAPLRTATASPVSRMQTPSLVSPIPQSPRAWTGGNQGGLIGNAGNAYSGGYGGSNNIPRSPSFPLSPQVPQQRQPRFPPGYTQSPGGYQRF